MARQNAKYLRFNGFSTCKTRGNQEAKRRGCNKIPEDVTTQWWTIWYNTANNKYAIEVPDYDQGGLTGAEKSELVTIAEANKNWIEIDITHL